MKRVFLLQIILNLKTGSFPYLINIPIMTGTFLFSIATSRIVNQQIN